MAAAPTPDPSQQAGPSSGPPSGAPASPQLMMLAHIKQAPDEMAQQTPAASAGLAKASSAITEAMSAIVSQPQQQSPQSSPSY